MDKLPLETDLSMAEAFLSKLDGNGPFTFQTFPDSGPKHGARVLHGTLAQHGEALAALNRGGHGIFVMVNRGDGVVHEGAKSCRTNANVVEVRSLFVDLDGASPTPLLTAAPCPSILVESSPGRYHAYWPVIDCPLDNFSALQTQLAAKFNGDRSVKDLARVMRLPGFAHQKKETPFITRLISLGDLR